MAFHEDKETHHDERIEHATTTLSARSSAASSANKASAADAVEAEQIVGQWRDGTIEEKRLVRKLDWRILPCAWVLYLLGYLDRANVRYVNDV